MIKVPRRRDDRGYMHPFVVDLLEALLGVAVRARLTFDPAVRADLERGLLALERRRHALEDAAVCERIAALQSAQGPPVIGAP